MGQSWTNKARKLGMLCAINLSLYLHCFAAVDQGEKKVTLHVVEESCVKVFKQIEKQTKMSFFYSTSDIKLPVKVSIQVVDAALDEVMGRLLEGTGLEWIYTDNIITIRKKKGLAGGGNGMGSAADSTGNTITVTGKVVQADGQPIPGATVRVKRTGDGVTTDEDGNFSLSNTKKNDLLLFSFIGYETREISISGNSILVKLSIAVNKLDETVVKGYYTTTKRLNTGNVTTIKSDVISHQPVGNPIEALIGRVAGLAISSQGGLPGSGQTVYLRGRNSIFNGTDPLYIIDGVPFSSTSLSSSSWGAGALPATGMSPFNSLNPADIESIEILKDADATAIYGSRGANGVILINTKKGTPGKTKVGINIYSGIGKVGHFINLLNTNQYLAMRREAFANDGATPGINDFDVNGAFDTTRYTDWQKTLIGGESKITDVQTSLTGGNNYTKFLLSAGYRRETTVYPADFSDKKGSVRANISHTSQNRRLNLDFSANYVYDDSNLPTVDLTSNIALPPNAPRLFKETGELNWPKHMGITVWTNPVNSLLRNAGSKTHNLISNIKLSQEIIQNLTLTCNAGYNYRLMNQSIKYPGTSFTPDISDVSTVRRNTVSATNNSTWIIEPQINYTHLSLLGTLNILIGGTLQQEKYNSTDTYASSFPSDQLLDNLGAAVYRNITTDSRQYRYSALFGRINYNWREKYLLNLTGRRDGSSRFGSDRQYGTFGAIGLAWIFSQEQFIKKLFPEITFGKLRGSYGTTGSDKIGDYQYLSTYSSLGVNYQGVSGLYPTRLTNPGYGWERVNKFEAGIELGLLSNRIYLDFSYYRNLTKNQLIGYTLSAVTGFTNVQANLPATISNSGIEFEVNTRNIEHDNFNWSSSFNIAIPKNRLISYPNFESSSNYFTYVLGRSLFDRRAFHYIGVSPETGTYAFATKNANQRPSYPQDLNSVRKLGPQFQAGFQNSVSYKGFKLQVFFQFVRQRGPNFMQLFSMPGSYSPTPNQPTDVLSNWKNPGDVRSVQKFTQNFDASYESWATYFSDYSDANSTDNSFIRLKNIHFSYDFSDRWLKRLLLDKFSIYLQCQNLLTFTKYKGLDPETQSLSLPPLRIITIGANLSF